jgi:dipeptidyl aminopeptidase/acylaminoacyl peptidase
MASRLAAVLASTLTFAMVLVAPAHAGFPPAQNGKIAFLKSGSDCLQMVNPDGTGQFQPGACFPRSSYPGAGLFGANGPQLSPVGNRVAFSVYNASKDVFDIINSKLDGTDAIVIPGFSYYAPTINWSQDGKWISSVTEHTCAELCGTLLVHPSDGTGTARYVDDPATPGAEVSWGSQGRMAYQFTFTVDSPQVIKTSAPDGAPSFLTGGEAPDWSPGSDRIAFFRSGIAVINANGSGLHNLTTDVQDSAPKWSPDGQKILFDSHRDGNYEIYVMNPDGSGQTNLTMNAAADYGGTWSPDGRQIAFGSSRGGVAHIYVMNRDGSGLVQVTNNPGGDGLLDWQRILNSAPDCSGVTASRSVLTTHNRRFVPVALDGATDPDGDRISLSIGGVTQDEPVTGPGDRTSPDAIAGSGGEVRIRAERNSKGDGRVYRIAFRASDGRGGECSGTATVSVPRKKRKPAVDSAPPSYDSFAR